MRLQCAECRGTGEIVFTKERGGPKCNFCNGAGHLTLERFIIVAAGILDGSSVYMGGPSQQSRKRAARLAEYLQEWGLFKDPA